MRLSVGNVPNITGFAVCNVPAEHYFWALVSCRLTSDDPKFYDFIKKYQRSFLMDRDTK